MQIGGYRMQTYRHLRSQHMHKADSKQGHRSSSTHWQVKAYGSHTDAKGEKQGFHVCQSPGARPCACSCCLNRVSMREKLATPQARGFLTSHPLWKE